MVGIPLSFHSNNAHVCTHSSVAFYTTLTFTHALSFRVGRTRKELMVLLRANNIEYHNARCVEDLETLAAGGVDYSALDFPAASNE